MRNDWKPKKAAAAILPTPLYKLENLSAQLKSDVYIKRDDMTGMAFGGNKLRKLDYLVQEAKDAGYTTLLTFGGTQTNHGRQTAAVACKYNHNHSDQDHDDCCKQEQPGLGTTALARGRTAAVSAGSIAGRTAALLRAACLGMRGPGIIIRFAADTFVIIPAGTAGRIIFRQDTIFLSA